MELKKLFRVLVMGGSVIGAVAATNSIANEPADSQADKSMKSKKGPDLPDAGQPEEKGEAGGGVKGW
jgi:hypothetical protein